LVCGTGFFGLKILGKLIKLTINILNEMNKWYQLIIGLSVFCAGCGVSSFKAQNWQLNEPNNLSSQLYRNANLDICLQQAHEIELKQNPEEDQSKYGVRIDHHANINKPYLQACMETRGYKLRDLTSTEVFLNTISVPIALPMKLVGKDFDDIY
jgi:hypothetical protein